MRSRIKQRTVIIGMCVYRQLSRRRRHRPNVLKFSVSSLTWVNLRAVLLLLRCMFVRACACAAAKERYDFRAKGRGRVTTSLETDPLRRSSHA